jgi:hypothetical protein
VQNKRSEEHQEEHAQTVGYEDEILLVWKQKPCPRQDEGKKAPRENQRPENAVSGRVIAPVMRMSEKKTLVRGLKEPVPVDNKKM